MTHEQFVFWLRGFLASSSMFPRSGDATVADVQHIKSVLATVLGHAPHTPSPAKDCGPRDLLPVLKDSHAG